MRNFASFVALTTLGALVVPACAGTDGDSSAMTSPTTSASATGNSPSTVASTTAISSTTSSAVSTTSAVSSTNTSSTSSMSLSSSSGSTSTSAAESTSAAAGISFNADIHPILTAKCSGDSCHSGSFFDKYAVAEIDGAYAAANAESEKLLMRTNDGSMPLGMQCLSGGTWSTAPECLTETERALLEEWSAAGAPM